MGLISWIKSGIALLPSGGSKYDSETNTIEYWGSEATDRTIGMSVFDITPEQLAKIRKDNKRPVYKYSKMGRNRGGRR